MISNFPSFYPDELLYSITARLASRYRIQSDGGIMDRFLYGSRDKHLGFGFPTGIGHLINLMPARQSCTADSIINNHTFLPFYEPFLPVRVAARFRAAMESETKATIPTRGLGISKASDDTRSLRFCPLCQGEDRKQFGETYWRRLHQIPLVKVCPQHHIFLQDSTLDRRLIRTRRIYVSADAACSPQKIIRVNTDNKSHAFFVWMAEQAKWMLGHNRSGSKLIELKQFYRKGLREIGLASIAGKIDVYKLREEFREFYGDELLKALNSPLATEIEEFWLKQWTRNFQIFQPIQRHLMLMYLLGVTPQDCFTSVEQPADEQKGPWECLNPFSPCKGKFTIHKFSIQSRQPKAIFRCPDCEYEYSRRFPLTAQDQIVPAYVRNRGPVWCQRLLTLWMDRTLSVQEVSRRMLVTQPTVVKYAMREGFPIPRPGSPNWKPTPSMIKVAALRPTRSKTDIRAAHRLNWLSFRKQYPEKSRSELNREIANTYHWLSNNDNQWLKEHLPPAKVRPAFNVDWPQRDKFLSPLVKDICAELLGKAEFAETAPVRIPITAVQKALKKRSVSIGILNNLKYLPLTAKALSRYIDESRESLVTRKVAWAVQRCSMLLLRPTFSRFVILARLETLRSKVRGTDSMIKKAVTSLQNIPSNAVRKMV